MGNSYRGQAALAIVLCLPATPALAATLPAVSAVQAGADVASRDEPRERQSGEVVPLDAVVRDDLAGWELAESTSRPIVLGEAEPTFLPQDPARYGPASDDAVEANATPSSLAGPPVPLTPSGHVPREYASHRGFFQQVGSSKTEILLLAGYVGAQSIPKLFKATKSFHFKDEGWFGRGTQNVGMDKLTHAFNTYLIAEILHSRIHRNTGGSEGDALTAGILASGMMALNEISDAIETTSGYSMQDIAMNLAGASFSVLRNTVPGLKEKLAFKIEIMPNDDIYSKSGKKHYQQERFMLSLKGAGFEKLQSSPLRFVDFQLGYYGSNFLNSDREKGITPKRHIFVGVGLNLGELLFGTSQSGFGKAARSAFDYIQLPYTSLRYNVTDGGGLRPR